MRYLEPSGTALRLPVIGQGTWGFGEDPRRHRQEVEALREGFERGMTLVDTAELYGAGESERVVGDAIADCRDSVFLITKIWPNHAEPDAMRRALEASLRRMRTDRVDVCLLHWPTTAVPLPGTVPAHGQGTAAGSSGRGTGRRTPHDQTPCLHLLSC